MMYFEKLEEGASAQPFVAGSVVVEKRAGHLLSPGWALRSTKKSFRFNFKQKNYLNKKFLRSVNKLDIKQTRKTWLEI